MLTIIQGRYEEAKEAYLRRETGDFFEFHFPYVGMQEVFRELGRFMWESKHLNTRFANRYQGPVLIDITDWNDKAPNEYFEAFLYYLQDQPGLRCTFLVQDACRPVLVERMKAVFHRDIRVEEVASRDTGAQTRRMGFHWEEDDHVRV